MAKTHQNVELWGFPKSKYPKHPDPDPLFSVFFCCWFCFDRLDVMVRLTLEHIQVVHSDSTHTVMWKKCTDSANYLPVKSISLFCSHFLWFCILFILSRLEVPVWIQSMLTGAVGIVDQQKITCIYPLVACLLGFSSKQKINTQIICFQRQWASP